MTPPSESVPLSSAVLHLVGGASSSVEIRGGTQRVLCFSGADPTAGQDPASLKGHFIPSHCVSKGRGMESDLTIFVAALALAVQPSVDFAAGT